MAEPKYLNPPSTPTSDTRWVIPEIRDTRSLYCKEGIKSAFCKVGNSEEWEVIPMGDDYVISDTCLDCIIPMYEVVFESMQVSLPFTKFEVELLNIHRVAPSQIYPSGWALIK
ncbi:hypothetical protein A2U01_0047074, partial [Trifolium medium]|nr:hypothetical protein [Trifolium medium]